MLALPLLLAPVLARSDEPARFSPYLSETLDAAVFLNAVSAAPPVDGGVVEKETGRVALGMASVVLKNIAAMHRTGNALGSVWTPGKGPSDWVATADASMKEAAYHARPITAAAWCLRCHGEPRGAADPMFPKYKMEGWKEGAVIGAATARVRR